MALELQHRVCELVQAVHGGNTEGSPDWLNRPARAGAPGPHWSEKPAKPARCRLTDAPDARGPLDHAGQFVDREGSTGPGPKPAADRGLG